MIEKGKGQIFTSLTGMRGIACICIMCYHYFCLYMDNLGLGVKALPFYPHSEFFFAYSKNAVELFFMLSGFLIAFHYHGKIAYGSPWEYLKKRYTKLIIPSAIVNLWALINAWIMLRAVPGSNVYISSITPLRIVLSVLMVNTGWITSYGQTGLPLNSTMWFIDVLLLCYLLYCLICKFAKNHYLYLSACMVMVLIGWGCLQHSPNLPFLWGINGRGYAPFFLGALICEFQIKANEKVRKGVSVVWGTMILGFLIIRLVIGFENIFGTIGSSSYVRYFEFFAAPGLLLVALNLHFIAKFLEWKPFVWLGMMSGALYYVHNNVLEDYYLLNAVLRINQNFSSEFVFLAVLSSIIPFAVLWQYWGKKGMLRKIGRNNTTIQ